MNQHGSCLLDTCFGSPPIGTVLLFPIGSYLLLVVGSADLLRPVWQRQPKNSLAEDIVSKGKQADNSFGADWLWLAGAVTFCDSWLPYVQPARFKAASVPTGYNWLVQLQSDKVETESFDRLTVKDKTWKQRVSSTEATTCTQCLHIIVLNVYFVYRCLSPTTLG